MSKTYKDIDPGILRSLENPSGGAYEIKVQVPELTFLGVAGQPDFGKLLITFYPGPRVIELKSPAEYGFRFVHDHRLGFGASSKNAQLEGKPVHRIWTFSGASATGRSRGRPAAIHGHSSIVAWLW